MLHNRKNYSFDKKTGQFIPINLFATQLTKCLNCGMQVQFDKMQNHLNSHIGQNILGQKREHDTQVQNPLKLQDNLTIASTNINFIDTQTIMASQLPNPQIYKMNIKRPQHNQEIEENQKYLRMGLDVDSQIQTHRDDMDVQSRVQPDYMDSLKKVQVSQGDYYQKIKIHHKTVNNKTKQINLFTKTNQGQNYVDDKFITKSKSHIKHIQEKGQKYRVQMIQHDQLKQKRYADFQLHQSRYSEKNKNIQIAFDQGRLEGAISNRFTTFESPPLQSNLIKKSDRQKMDRYSQKQKQEYRFRSHSILNQQRKGVQQPFWLCSQLHKPKQAIQAHQHNFDNTECPCCGGFYCPVCKSTIPPQYRRIERPNLQKSKVTIWGGQN